MHDELHPLLGGRPVRVVQKSVSCRFKHGDHEHMVQFYPETGMYQVKWQHKVPNLYALAALHMGQPALMYKAQTCWYTLHQVPNRPFHPPWETLRDGDWVPFSSVRPQPAA